MSTTLQKLRDDKNKLSIDIAALVDEFQAKYVSDGIFVESVAIEQDVYYDNNGMGCHASVKLKDSYGV